LQETIAIIGGGIGGVAAAVALHQAGISATLYERSREFREAGAGMMLWPNATRVLRELGLLEKLIARSGPNTNFLVRASYGTVLMNIALGQFDVPAVCARRSDLLAVLLDALPPERVRLGCELTHLEQTGSKVRLHFRGPGGRQQIEEHDAAIGADGLHSQVRETLFGPSAPIYRGYAVWRGVASYRGTALCPGFNSETWGHGKRFGILNTGPNRFTWYAAANVPRSRLNAPACRQQARTERDADSNREQLSRTAALCATFKEELFEMFADPGDPWHDPVVDLIRASGAPAILKHGAFDRAPLDRWTDGRITLLGDAAHPCTPNLGQGGCMALEDALVLAKSVSRSPSIAEAFERYESLRRPRTRHIQQRSLAMGRIGQWENRVVVAGRRVVTSILPAALFEHNLRRVYSYET
jgi:2-polyprenyl-6-methoxyphenol hydroxylase-like FAD-dependent oxidoreductase